MLAARDAGASPANPSVLAAAGINPLQSAEPQGPDGAVGAALSERRGDDSSIVAGAIPEAASMDTTCSATIEVGASMLLASAIPPPLKAVITTTQQRAIIVRMQRVTPHKCGQHGAAAIAGKDDVSWLSKRDAKSTPGVADRFFKNAFRQTVRLSPPVVRFSSA